MFEQIHALGDRIGRVQIHAQTVRGRQSPDDISPNSASSAGNRLAAASGLLPRLSVAGDPLVALPGAEGIEPVGVAGHPLCFPVPSTNALLRGPLLVLV